MSCPDPYPSKPDYSTFYNNYSSYISEAAGALGIPQSVVASQWYGEWGIPINNPANQGSTFGQCADGTCGSFPFFCSLGDGTQAYIDPVSYSYNGGSNAFSNIYKETVNWANNYDTGFTANAAATGIPTDPNASGTVCSQTSTSRGYVGIEDTPPGSSEDIILEYQQRGALAVMEGMGASPWDGGHYWQCGDAYAGYMLQVIAEDSGWLSSLS